MNPQIYSKLLRSYKAAGTCEQEWKRGRYCGDAITNRANEEFEEVVKELKRTQEELAQRMKDEEERDAGPFIQESLYDYATDRDVLEQANAIVRPAMQSGQIRCAMAQDYASKLPAQALTIVKMNKNPVEFVRRNANVRAAAMLAKAAYKDGDTPGMHVTDLTVWSEGGPNLAGVFVAYAKLRDSTAHPGFVVVSFKGTDSPISVLLDVKFVDTKRLPATKANVHVDVPEAAYRAVEERASDILQAVGELRESYPRAAVLCTGHSLGAGMALLFQLYLTLHDPILAAKMETIVFAAPMIHAPVSKNQETDLLLLRWMSRCINVVRAGDIVPLLAMGAQSKPFVECMIANFASTVKELVRVLFAESTEEEEGQPQVVLTASGRRINIGFYSRQLQATEYAEKQLRALEKLIPNEYALWVATALTDPEVRRTLVNTIGKASAFLKNYGLDLAWLVYNPASWMLRLTNMVTTAVANFHSDTLGGGTWDKAYRAALGGTLRGASLTDTAIEVAKKIGWSEVQERIGGKIWAKVEPATNKILETGVTWGISTASTRIAAHYNLIQYRPVMQNVYLIDGCISGKREVLLIGADYFTNLVFSPLSLGLRADEPLKLHFIHSGYMGFLDPEYFSQQGGIDMDVIARDVNPWISGRMIDGDIDSDE